MLYYMYCMYPCSNPVYLGNMLNDNRVHQIEQQIRVSLEVTYLDIVHWIQTHTFKPLLNLRLSMRFAIES